MWRETVNLEFKKEITKSYLKTVSAFANYNDGQVIFGIDDNGNTVGIEKPEKSCLNIENTINDSIKPVPEYDLQITDQNTIILNVYKGDDTPYYYNGKAYKRHDSSSVPVSTLELRRLSLEGRNENFEDLPAKNQNITFNYLEEMLCKYLNIERLSEDVLKTLGLFDGKKYNIAAELLADENSFPEVDIIKFGDSIDEILMRKTFSHISILKALDETINVFRDNYTYEVISGMTRKKVENIPEEAFREALANAFIHREWDLSSSIQIAMFDDRIEITSPGGLPAGLSKYEYLNTMISNLRNPKIADVFLKTHLIEKFGTGIFRIKKSYKKFVRKPNFDIHANSITITLPLITQYNIQNRHEQLIVNEIEKNGTMSRSELEKLTGFKTDKVLRLLKKMTEKHLIQKVGSGRATKYKLYND